MKGVMPPQLVTSGSGYVTPPAAIMGALSLYLSFINMFVLLLSLFGNRE